MTRAEIEKRLQYFSREFVSRVEKAPLGAVGVAFLVGIVFGQVWRLLLPIIFLGVVGGAVYFFLSSQPQEPVDPREADDDRPLKG